MVRICAVRFLNLMDVVILDLLISKQGFQNTAEMNRF
jgi:hypothetical protein